LDNSRAKGIHLEKGTQLGSFIILTLVLSGPRLSFFLGLLESLYSDLKEGQKLSTGKRKGRYRLYGTPCQWP